MRTFLAALVVLSFPAFALAAEKRESLHGAPAPAAMAAPAAEAAPAAPAAPAAEAAPAAPAAGPASSDATAAEGGGASGASGASAGGASGGGSKATKSAKSSSRSSGSSSSAAMPAATKVGPEECDLCKARSAYLKAGKTQTTGLNNGVVIVSTGNVGALDKAATEFDNQLKNAKDGKAKLDDGCVKFVGSLNSGKVTYGHGKTPNGHAITAMTSDENLALELYEMMEKVVVPKKGGKK